MATIGTAPTPDQGVGWRGISFPFRINKSGGVETSTTDDVQVEHILEGIVQLLGTNQYEREMRPEFYGNMDRLPFEPQEAAGGEATLAQYLIARAFKRWEKRVTLHVLEIIESYDETLILKLEYEVIATRQRYEQEITIQR